MFTMDATREHDNIKKSDKPKMAVLPLGDPRCHGLAEGFCRMACDTCPFVSKPIKDEYINKYRAQPCRKGS